MKPSFQKEWGKLKMIKYKYNVYGIAQEGWIFNGTCVSNDIIKAIEMFREEGYSTWSIERKEQVCANEKIEIKNINILDKYSTEGINKSYIYKLYKQIMKRNPNAIDKINTLDEAKQIINMIMGKLYINVEIYESLDKICKKQEEI